jgi:hypothetical protein
MVNCDVEGLALVRRLPPTVGNRVTSGGLTIDRLDFLLRAAIIVVTIESEVLAVANEVVLHRFGVRHADRGLTEGADHRYFTGV